MKRTHVAAAVAALGLTAALVGCSPPASGGVSPTPGGASPTSAEPRSITYWASQQGPSIEFDEEVLTAALGRFTARTGIDVELEVIPWTDMYNRMLAAISSGEGPDVMNAGNTWSVSLQETGALLPFEGEALAGVGGSDRFLPANMGSTGAPGAAPTSLPLYGFAYSLYYNTAIFEDAGIAEAPKTWQELVDIAHKLTVDTDGDGKIDQWGVALAGNRIPANAHAAFMYGSWHGGHLYDADGKPTFDDPGVVQGVKMWVDLMADGVVDPANSEYNTVGQIQDDLVAGRAAMIIDQNPHAAFASRDFTGWGIAPIPVIDPLKPGGEAIRTHVSGINISIFKNTDDLDASLQLVKALTDDEQVHLNSSYGLLPVTEAAFGDPAFEADYIQLKREILATSSKPMPLVNTEGQMETLVGTAIGQLFATIASGGTVTEDDVRAALADANAQIIAQA